MRETNYDVKNFIKIMYNIVNSGLMNGGCTIISAISFNYKGNSAWSCLWEILNNIVLKYIIPKVKIQRCGYGVIKILEFYLLGFIKFIQITSELVYQLEDNIKYLVIHALKDPKNMKPILREYLDFLFVFVHFVENSTNTLNFSKLKQTIDSIREEFAFQISQKDKIQIINNVSQYCIFNITIEDLNSQWKLSPLEMLISKYQTDDKHKGLVNLGNTCYINSTIQALFMTMDFREKVLQCNKNLKQSSLLNKFTITEEPTVNEALYDLFLMLLSSSEKYIIPTEFRKSLPELFKNSHVQQDASEFIKIYLDSLEKSLAGTPSQVINH